MRRPGTPPVDHARDDLVVFVHIPKTAGSTMRSVFRREYRGGLLIRDVVGPTPTPVVLPDHRALAGHVFTGIAEAVGRTGRYVTMLREPVAHAVSMFHHGVRKGRPHELVSWMREHPANPQTRWLASDHGDRRSDDVDDEVFARAVDRVASFDVVGTAEHFTDSVLVMARHFGWRTPYYVRLNRNPTGDGIDELPPGLATEIVERNSFDVELHRLACERLSVDLERIPLAAARRSLFVVRNALWTPSRRARVAVARRVTWRPRSSAPR